MKASSTSRAYVFVLGQEDAPGLLCDPRATFRVEEGEDGAVYLCKHADAAGAGHRVLVDGCTLGPREVDMRLYLSQFRPIQEKVLALAADVGVSSSVWLLGRHSSQLNSNLLFSEQQDDDLFRATLRSLFDRMSAPTALANEFMRLSWAVHIKCFEVFGDQIIDLLLPQSSDPDKQQDATKLVPGAGGGAHPPKLREHPQHGAIIVGLTRLHCTSPASAYAALHQAFRRRLILIAETSVSGSRNLFGQRVLGTVGCVFIQVEVEQALYPSRRASEEIFDPASSFKIRSNIQFNILADIDALSFKPSRQDTVNIVSLQDFLLHGVSKPADDVRLKSATAVSGSTLAVSHKSLSTLSRVLRLLAKQEVDEGDESGSSTIGSECTWPVPSSSSPSSHHIPYRDSILTRVLQPSLEGNYVNLVYLCISNESNASTSQGLRMAMELRGKPQHIERVVVSDESQPQFSPKVAPKIPALPVKARLGLSGPFVGQGKRKNLDRLPLKKVEVSTHAHQRSSSQDFGMGAESDEDEESFCDGDMEKSFWDVLSRLRADQNSFLASARCLEELDAERQKLLDSLEVELEAEGPPPGAAPMIARAHSDITPVASDALLCQRKKEMVKRTLTLDISPSGVKKNDEGASGCDGSGDRQAHLLKQKAAMGEHLLLHHARPPALGSFTNIDNSRLDFTTPDKCTAVVPRTDPKSDINLANRSKVQASQSRPVYTPLDIGSPGFDARPPVWFVKPTGKRDNSGASNIGTERDDSSSLPQPVGSKGVVVSRAPHAKRTSPRLLPGIDTSISPSTRNPQASPSSFSRCYAADSGKTHVLHNDADLIETSRLSSNIYFDNPSSFIDICEQQEKLGSLVSPGSDFNPSPNSSCHATSPLSNSSVMTGKNIWGSSSPPPQQQQDSWRTQPLGQPHRRVSGERENHGSEKHQLRRDRGQQGPGRRSSSDRLITVPDLGLGASDVKVKANVNFQGSILSAPYLQSNNAAVTLPLLHTTTSEVESEAACRHTEGGANSPIRVSVTKNHSLRACKEVADADERDDDEGLSPEENAFMRAVSHSNFAEVKKHVLQGVNVHVKNSFARDAMQVAARNGNLDIMKFLAQSGASTATRGSRGDTLFHIAAGNGHVAVMRWLLSEQGSMHTLLDMQGQSAAHFAARRGEVGVLRLLHEELHMDLHEEDFEGLTPLQQVPRRALMGNAVDIAATRKFLVSVRGHQE